MRHRLEHHRRFPDELQYLTVLVVIALIIESALSAWPAHLARTGVAEAFSLAATIGLEMIEQRAVSGRWPAGEGPLTASSFGDDERFGKYVDGARIDPDGGFTVFFRQEAGGLAGQALGFRAAVNALAPDAPVVWLCGYRTAPAGHRVTARNHTTIPVSLLPAACGEPRGAPERARRLSSM